MKTIREIIRLFNLNLSVRNIASSCNISISTVSFYVNRFKSSGVNIGTFDLHSAPDVFAIGVGTFLIALFSARHFGKFNGGNSPAP